ncbi:MAG: His/Gly/Thr/Pro-type tRNA ligase C-terminal domain-containing protein, partial [bacterium]
INQWCNIVRWEMRPRLFLRTTEFLWQEGHTAHATEEEADQRARQMLEVYRSFAEDYLALPVLTGLKTEAEKFAGALRTYTIEAMAQDGKALQSGTSHNLGQNFAKPFKIKYLNQANKEEYVWQTSWGVSTRLIGALIMVHSDDQGLVLPPQVAPYQVVIVSIGDTLKQAKNLRDSLVKNGIRVKIDERSDLRPGPRYFEWEKKGVPLRLELGEKEIKDQNVVLVRRDNGQKETVKEKDLVGQIKKILADIQKNLYQRALDFRKAHTVKVGSWSEFKKAIEAGNFVEADWCGSEQCEAKIKDETKTTIRCLPLEAKKQAGQCIYCQKPSEQKVVFAKSY